MQKRELDLEKGRDGKRSEGGRRRSRSRGAKRRKNGLQQEQTTEEEPGRIEAEITRSEDVFISPG